MNIKKFLNNEVKPAFGCTEPGAVALAVARASEELPDRDQITSIHVTLSSSIYKNGMAVGIPGTNGAKGNAIAAALGAICGKSSLALEVLCESKINDVIKAKQWVKDGKVSVCCDLNLTGVYVLASVSTPDHKATCLVQNTHSNITKVIIDNCIKYENTNIQTVADDFTDDGFPHTLLEALKMADKLDYKDVRFLIEGVSMNMAIAKAGFKTQTESTQCEACAYNNNLRRTLIDLSEANRQNDIDIIIKSTCAAAAYARMSGIPLPVMSSAGSGNHGIIAILPVALLGKYLGKNDTEIAHAIAVSHIATSFIKRQLGRLSPVCGCSIAAGSGAAGGMVSLMGGDSGKVFTAMGLLLANLAGMLCDGAKESCAFKVSVASAEAYYVAKWVMSGHTINTPQGVLGTSIEETVANVVNVTKNGMDLVDRIIIKILNLQHQFENVV